MAPTTQDHLAVKRAACDRCRGQKLRCIPCNSEEGSGRCDRCRVARAECIYSPPTKPGRPPSSKHNSASRSVKSHFCQPLGEASLIEGQSPNQASTSNRELPRAHAINSFAYEEFAGTEDQQQQHQRQQLLQQDYELPLINSHFEAEAFGLDTNAISNPCFTNYFSPSRSGGEPTDEEFLSVRNPSTSTLVDHSTSWDNEYTIFEARDTSHDHSVEPSSMGDPALPSGYDVRHDANFEPHPKTSSYYRGTIKVPYDSGDRVHDLTAKTSLSTSNGIGEQTSKHCEQSRMPPLVRDQPQSTNWSTAGIPDATTNDMHPYQNTVQQLSELSAKLFVQINVHDSIYSTTESASEESTTKYTQQLEQLIKDVLESSTVFLDILTTLQRSYLKSLRAALPNTIDDANDAVEDPNMHPMPLSDNSDKSGSNPADDSTAYGRSAEVVRSSLRLKSISSSPATPDTATILQLLTAYIRVTQLHHILYHTLCSHLSPMLTSSDQALISISRCMPSAFSSSSSANNTLPFPSLSIGGISLQPYPRIQMKVLLQVCAHNLGEIEAVLGLPAAFRVSEPDAYDASTIASSGGSNGGGVLKASGGGTTLLVRTVMMEAGDTVQGIRELLAKLREGLRGSIDI